jgi:hypothetical protein
VLTIDELLRGLANQPDERQLGRMMLVIDVCNAAAGLTEAVDGVRTWLDGGMVGRTRSVSLMSVVPGRRLIHSGAYDPLVFGRALRDC